MFLPLYGVERKFSNAAIGCCRCCTTRRESVLYILCVPDFCCHCCCFRTAAATRYGFKALEVWKKCFKKIRGAAVVSILQNAQIDNLSPLFQPVMVCYLYILGLNELNFINRVMGKFSLFVTDGRNSTWSNLVEFKVGWCLYNFVGFFVAGVGFFVLFLILIIFLFWHLWSLPSS